MAAVVSGLGAVSPLGVDFDATWERIVGGHSGAGPITRFDTGAYSLRSRIAHTVDAEFGGRGADERAAGRFARLATVAAAEAVDDAGLDCEWDSERVGVAIGSGLGGLPELEDATERVGDGGRPSARFVVRFLPTMAAGHVSIALDAQGPLRAPASGCVASTRAIADAVDDIRLGRADVVVAGGAESAITPTVLAGFDAMRALSTRNDTPAAASRPFDAGRDGFVLGEGAGVIVLENREHAERRGVSPYATLAGTASAADAANLARPREDARGMGRAIERALADADTTPAAVDLVTAHATGTPRGDAHEARALRDVFGAAVPPVTAPKGAIGHTLGGAGAIEAALTAKTVETGTVPPTVNYETPDPDCDLPVVTAPTDRDVDLAVSNSAGFGGVNAALLFGRCPE
jgi:3-oxoacyl-[acyl-carrier-protein] synthase II